MRKIEKQGFVSLCRECVGIINQYMQISQPYVKGVNKLFVFRRHSDNRPHIYKHVVFREHKTKLLLNNTLKNYSEVKQSG